MRRTVVPAANAIAVVAATGDSPPAVTDIAYEHFAPGWTASGLAAWADAGDVRTVASRLARGPSRLIQTVGRAEHAQAEADLLACVRG